MKIKKVDDKPMVIHTKQKAKIHTHEPKLNILASGNRNSGAVETYIPDTETAFDWLNYHL